MVARAGPGQRLTACGLEGTRLLLLQESLGTPVLHLCPTLRWQQGFGERGVMPGSQTVP